MSSTKRNSSNYIEADYTLIRRCMAVILIPLSHLGFEKGDSQRVGDRTRTNSSASLGLELCNGISEGPGPPEPAKKCPGPEVFADFVRENSECYWNPCLVQSVRNLEYRGCVAPSTVLISGTDYSLEVVRSAWARRMLRAPCGYDISMIGDLDPVKMAVVAQTHFAPLPEALCKVVYDLNKEGTVANMAVIGSRLQATFPEIVLPEENVLYRALGTLIHERKLFHTGQGYSVVTPDTFRLLAMSPPLERQMLLTNDEAIVRLHGTAVTEGRTACTQTNQRDSTLTTWSSAERILSPSRNQSHQGKLKRCHSLKLLQRGRDKEKVFRSNSFRSSKASPAGESKSDAENIDPSVKKEKPSMFSKWFRRGRDKKSVPKSSTVSSQFPPRDRSDPDFVLYNSRATQTLERNERLPPKPNKSRSSSLTRATFRERHSQYLSSTPVTPKAVQRSSHYPQSSDIYHYRSSSLPRKSCPSPKLEHNHNNSHHHSVANRKPSPKPPSRQRQHQANTSSRVPTANAGKNRPHFESTFSPIVKSNEMLVSADDKYEEVIAGRQTGSVWPCRQNTANITAKPTNSLPYRNPTPPWRMLSNPTSVAEPKIAIGEPVKPLPIGLPQRIVSREVASVPPSTATPLAKPQLAKTLSESTVTTETTSPKKGLHIDGSVDVEINLGQILSGQHKPGLLNTDLDSHSKSDLLKIAASWNQSLTNNPKTNVSSDKISRNQTLSTTTSVKTSVSHGGIKGTELKSNTVELNSPVVSEGPVKVLKSTTVVDCTGKCTIVGELPNAGSNGVSSRSKLADAKRDFFAESPVPTEPVSLKDDSGFSSSTSTSRPMSVSPC